MPTAVLDKIDSVASVLEVIDLVDADDVESRLVGAISVEGCLVATVIVELVEGMFGD